MEGVYQQPQTVMNIEKYNKFYSFDFQTENPVFDCIRKELANFSQNENQNIDEVEKIFNKAIQIQTGNKTEFLLENLKKFYQKLQVEEIVDFIQAFIPKLGLYLNKSAQHLKNLKIPFLSQGDGEINLTRRQVAMIFANMFSCTLLPQKNQYRLPKNFTYSEIFQFNGHRENRNNSLQSKILCAYKYLRLIFQLEEKVEVNKDNQAENFLNQKICFKRKSALTKAFQIDQQMKDTKICNVEIEPTKKIEECDGYHVDFANKYLGGGVLNTGCVQEEIMFATSPELLVGLLFNPVMDLEESIIIEGFHNYCSYIGYAESFKFKEIMSIDQIYKEKSKSVICIDAQPFDRNGISFNEQFSHQYINREFTKAFSGFSQTKEGNKIATGNWGCGAFKGDPQVKFLIQLLVCSLVGKNMIYCTFKEDRLKNLQKVLLKTQGWDCFQILEVIKNYSIYISKLKGKNKAQTIFQHGFDQ